MADTIIDRVQVEIDATAKGSSDALKNLENQLKNLKSMLNSFDLSKMQEIQKASRGISIDSRGMTKEEKQVLRSLDRIKQAYAGLESYKNAAMSGDSSSMTTFDRKAIHLQSDIDVLGEKLRQVDDMMKGGNVDTAKFQAWREELAGVQAGLTEMQGEVGGASEGFASLKERAAEAGKKIMSAIGTGAVNVLKKLGDVVKKAAKHMLSLHHSSNGAHGSFKRGFMTILKYGFGIRSLYVLFRRLRKAVVESFGELQKSGAFFETTKENVTALRTALATLKFQFGAAFEPIFNAVAPALQSLINYLITAANAISAFMAKITGKNTYSKVAAVTLAAEKNTAGAAKAAKDLNKQLQKFDELNNLTTNNSGSGGGGGGGADTNDHATYVEESVENALGDFGKQLAEAIRQGDWRGVGEAISEKLTGAMNGIEWDKVYSKASGFGEGLAEFLNGLISPELFGAVGETLAGSLNTAFQFLNSFGKTFEWSEFGKSIGEGISDFFRKADFALYADTVHTWVAGILDAGIALLQNTDFEEIGKKIADFLNNLQVADIASKVLTFAKTLLSGIATAIESLWNNMDIQNKIGAALIGMIALANMTGLSAQVGTMLTNILTAYPIALGAPIAVIASFTIGWKIGNKIYETATGHEVEGGITDQIKEVFNGLFGKDKIKFDMGDFIQFTFGESNPWNDFWGDLGDKAYDGVQEIKAKFKEIAEMIVIGFRDGLKTYLSDVWEKVKEGFQSFIDSVKEFFGIHSPSTVFEGYGKDLIAGLLLGITNALSGIATWVKTNLVDPILKAIDFSGLVDKGRDVIEKIKSGISEKAKNLKEWFSTNVGEKIKNAWDDYKDLKVEFASKYEDIKDKVESFQKNIAKKLKTTVSTKLKAPSSKNKNSVKKKINDWKDGIDKSISMTLNLSSNVGNLADWVNNKIVGPVNDMMKKVATKNSIAWTPIKGLATGGYVDRATQVIVGEAGGEAVIPLERNLGAINKIAGVMLDGMANVSKYRYNPQMPTSAPINSGISSSNYDYSGSDNRNYDAIMEQNRLLAEQNRLLQQIANKDVTISSRDVFNATRSEAQNYNNRTGNSPFVF